LSSVMTCWNIVATDVNMSFRDELFALGPWTDLVLVVCVSRQGGTHFSHYGGAGLCSWGRLRLLQLLCCCVALLWRTALGWCGWKRTPFPL
jgi:hypothetical protein